MPDASGLRPLEPEDFGVVAEWLSVPSTNRWLTSEWRGRIVTPALIAAVQRSKRNQLLIVESSEVAVGLVGLADIDDLDKTAMIWYIRGVAGNAHKGALSRGVGQAVSFAYAEIGLSSVYAWIMADNIASRRVLERNQFREVGVIRNAAYSNGVCVDRVYFDHACLAEGVVPSKTAGNVASC